MGNLPVRAGLSSFLGREDLLADLGRVPPGPGQGRLVTLTGAPGIGKSRLGLELGHRLGPSYPDGAWLVALAPVADGALVAAAVAAALNVVEEPAEGLAATLLSRLAGRRLLLLLDNCEHLLDACAELVGALLGRCPGVTVVATSREPLGAPGEVLCELPALTLPASTDPEAVRAAEAGRLFVERAGTVQAGFAVNGHVAPAVVEICRRLDGIPLAIELAAAHVGRLTPAEIAGGLDDRFGLLTVDLAEPAHHRTLRAALDWSHALLPPAERALLRRLSVFVGGFDLEAADATCAGEQVEAAAVVDLLARLAARSLLVRDADPMVDSEFPHPRMTRHTYAGSPPAPSQVLPVPASAARGAQLGLARPRGHANSESTISARYRLLETVRAYARDQLDQAGERPRVREAHARYFVALAERAEPELTGPDQQRWFALLESERPNLRAALEWSLGRGQARLALRLAGALVLYWRVRCHFREGRELLEAALTVSGDAAAGDREATRLRAKALWGAGFMALMADDVDGATPPLEASLAAFSDLGDGEGRARALLLLGNCRQLRHLPGPSSLATLEQSATLARAAGDAWCLAHALGIAGLEHRARDELAAARPLFAECLSVARAAQDRQGLRLGLLGLGEVAAAEGDCDGAEALLLEAIAVADELGEDYTKARALQELGLMALAQGRHARAGALLDGALVLVREVAPGKLVPPLVHRARLHRAEGEPADARRLLEEALNLALASPDSSHAGQIVGELGDLARAEGDPAQAAARSLEAALADGLGSQAKPGRTPDRWASLTEVELRIAALVADGLTNAAIAQRLFISFGSVKAHLSRIFSTLGIARRAELAREVSRRRAGGV